ncbi:uncharacterized protein LOC143300668 [Babylonia areolata]|uniref:uncharacterized protein LOC143300668 n=1 Tax=Babylonia areolata TaxID=304850 RepID=UPI003FD3F3D8
MISRGTIFNIGNVENLFLSLYSTPIGVQQSQGRCQIHQGELLELFCANCFVRICPCCKLCEHDGHKVQSLQLAAARASQYIEDTCNHRLTEYHQFLETQMAEVTDRQESLCSKVQDTKDRVEKRHAELLAFLDDDNHDVREKLLAKHFRSVTGAPAERPPFDPSSTDIGLRRDHLLPMIKDCVVNSLQGLDGASEQVHSQLRNTADLLQHEMERLQSVQGRCYEAVEEKNQGDVLRLYREVHEDWGDAVLTSRQVSLTPPSIGLFLLNLTDDPRQEAGEDVLVKLLLCDRRDDVQSAVRQVLGVSVGDTGPPLQGGEHHVLVQPQFRFSDSKDAYAYSLCPGLYRVGVSYSPWSKDKGYAKTEFFLHSGNRSVFQIPPGLYTVATSSALQADGFSYCFFPVAETKHQFNSVYELRMFAKTGTEMIMMLTETTEHHEVKLFRVKPFTKYLTRKRHKITFSGIKFPVNFDISEDRKYLALVVRTETEQKEGAEASCGHEVHVHTIVGQTGKKALTRVSTYRPPAEGFLPTDVCFFTVGHREVLLVSDLHSHSIHIVHPATCRLLSHLVHNHPLLTQPTALNKDIQGRLWVACRGGHIVTVEVMG